MEKYNFLSHPFVPKKKKGRPNSKLVWNYSTEKPDLLTGVLVVVVVVVLLTVFTF